MDPCALTALGFLSLLAPVLCFLGFRTCPEAEHRHPSEDLILEPQFFFPRAHESKPAKSVQPKRSLQQRSTPVNASPTVHLPRPKASQVAAPHRQNVRTLGHICRTSSNSFTSSMFEELCASLTPEEVAAYTPYYRCKPSV